MNPTLGEIQRFWATIQRTSTCWIWKGSHLGAPGGYGRFSFRNKLLMAHRFSYELFIGEIPKGMQIDHLCQRPLCVNPDHMEAVSGIANLLRGNGRGAINARKTHCAKGHPFDESNTYLIPNGTGRACLMCRKAWVAENIDKVRASGRRATAAYRARKKSAEATHSASPTSDL